MEDLGPFSGESVDYPDYARRVAEAADGRARLGLLVCGTGIGMSIAANRARARRTARPSTRRGWRGSTTTQNVLCIGERVVGLGLGRRS